MMLPSARRMLGAVAAVLAVPALVISALIVSVDGSAAGHDGHLAAAVTAAASSCAAHEDHEAEGDACGLDAKALQARFEMARAAVQGARLPVAEYREGSDVGATIVPGEVNVGLEAGASAQAIAARLGLDVKHELSSLGLATLVRASADANATRDLVRALASEPGVRFAEPNFVARTASTPSDPFLPLEKGARYGNVEKAWDVTTGKASVVVAVLDTGVDQKHKDLVNRLVPGWDFVNNKADAADDNGHGTTVAGIIAAEGNNGQGIAGVAYDARVMPLKVADGEGNASVANVAAGLDWAVSHGAKVANLSLGTRVFSQALKDACDRATRAGVLVVAAAGNDPIHVACYPAAFPGVLCVTSLDDKGQLAFSAVVSPRVDVAAPGEEIVTTYPGGVYGFVSGSSAASAFASGVAALCWSRSPLLTNAQVAQCLRAGVKPIAALDPVRGLVRFGSLDAADAVARASSSFIDLAITDVRSYPARPVAGAPVTYVVEVTNQGAATTVNSVVKLAYGTSTQVGARSIATFNPGDRVELSFNATAPAVGSPVLEASVQPEVGETAVANNKLTLPLTVGATAVPDLRVVERTVSDPNLTTGAVSLGMTVENRGGSSAANVVLEMSVNGSVVATTTIPSLAVGERTKWTTPWTAPVPAPTGVVQVRARAKELAGETSITDNIAVLHFYVGTAGALRGLYQQSNGVDVIPDAPWRLEPGRTYVPVQVFVPSMGATIGTTKLKVNRCTVTVRDDAGSTNGTVVYDHSFGQNPAVAPAALTIVDELGNVRAAPKEKQLFASAELTENGHHDILRMPRDAYGVAATPSTPVVKFTDVKVEWTYNTSIFYSVLSTTRSGSHRSVLRTTFASQPLPNLPGENHAYDVHHHTIAEWFFGSQLNVFAPRKAYGGPIQMIKESAYAMGVIGAAADVKGRIICTDHNCFYNTTIPNANGPDYRPPLGPTSIAAQPNTTQKEAYETIFGVASGEEIAYKQEIPISKFTSAIPDVLSGLLPGLPIGAHMLLMKAEHIEGPWHGGGWLKGPGNPNIDVELFPLFDRVAKQNQPRNGGSFAYCAHPFGGQGWSDASLDRGFGLVPNLRSREAVHDATNKFVLKGLEFFNGRGTRSLDSGKIDFNDLNPWADSQYVAGSSDWDTAIQGGLTYWHQALAKTLEYSFTNEPDVRFSRKIYVAGGSDAHGDFNFDVSRLATPVSFQSTFGVGDAAWYGVRTYCFGDGKAGATSGERWMQAYEDGNSLMTDGPLLSFSMDADSRFDSTNLKFHAKATAAENEDGRVGGGGALDGERSMLVRRGSPDLAFKYRYTNSSDFGSNKGEIVAIKIYKTEAGAPNPTRKRGSVDQLVGKGSLATAGADKDLTQNLDPAREGAFSKLGCISLGAFTGVDPDVANLGPNEYRCYTNPVFAIPYDAAVTVAKVDSATKTIAAGDLTLTLTFDTSMSPSLYAAEVKATDANGDTTDKSVAALAALKPAGGQNGWTDRPGVKNSVLTLTNAGPVAVNGAEYPAGSGKVTLVLYVKDKLKDAAGNSLHSIAVSTTAPYIAGPGAAGTTAPPSTAGGPSFGGGGGGGGGCALVTSGTSSGTALLPFVLVIVGVVLMRRRAV